MHSLRPTQILPSGSCSVIVGEGNWLYAWPHDLLPDAIDGFEVKSTPVDNSLHNRGKTMQNWTKPVVYETDSGKQVFVWCNHDYEPESWMPMFCPAHYKRTDFHDLKAGFGIPSRRFGTNMPQFSGELYMTFRMGDTVFELYVQDNVESNAKNLLFRIAEAIYQKNLHNQRVDPTSADAQSLSR